MSPPAPLFESRRPAEKFRHRLVGRLDIRLLKQSSLCREGGARSPFTDSCPCPPSKVGDRAVARSGGPFYIKKYLCTAASSDRSGFDTALKYLSGISEGQMKTFAIPLLALVPLWSRAQECHQSMR